MKRKQIITMALAAVMSITFSVQKVGAAETVKCPPHTPVNTIEYTGWSTEHKVYRNLFMNGQQLYSICTVDGTTKWYVLRCKECKAELHKDFGGTTESHSLANDPDHK